MALGLISFSVFAAVPPGNDVTTNPEKYFLKNSEAIDSLALLPPPPEVGSIAFLNVRPCMKRADYFVVPHVVG